MNSLLRHVKGLSLASLLLPAFSCGRQESPPDPGVAIQNPLTIASTDASAPSTILYQTAKVTAVQEGDWVRWQFTEKLASQPESHVYRGTRTKEGDCGFTGSGSSTNATQDVVYIERTVAVNSNQCLMETESASLQRKDAIDRHLMVEDAKRGGTSKTDPGQEAGSALQLESGYTYSGSIQTQIEDPVNIDVADARSNIEWNSNSSCITAWHRWPDWYWFGPSGWGLNSSSWPGTDPNANWCDSVNQTTTGNFTNEIFCFFFDTWANHNSTQYYAYPNGGRGWSWNSSWGGGCSSLLSFSVVAN